MVVMRLGPVLPSSFFQFNKGYAQHLLGGFYDSGKHETYIKTPTSPKLSHPKEVTFTKDLLLGLWEWEAGYA